MYSFESSWRALFHSPLKLPAISGDVFVFGAAPNPVVPDDLLRNATIATANASQLTLEAYGVKQPHITFMRTDMSAGRDVDIMKLESLRGRRTGLLVLLDGREARCEAQLALLSKVDYRFDDVLMVTRIQRSVIQNRVLDGRNPLLLKKYRPSMGLQAVLFSLDMGASSVAIAGVSFRADGCSFSTLNYKRNHVDSDRDVLMRIRSRRLPVYAVEEHFAADTGLQRWSPVAAAA